jgi:hypothetical protein
MGGAAISTNTPMRPCHNCRRNRRRCDRSVPSCSKCHTTGQECLGYGKLLLWTDSVASRGKMMGKTFAIDTTPETKPMVTHPQSSDLTTSSKLTLPNIHQTVLLLDSISSWCSQPDDTAFQNLSRSSDFYLSYCKFLVA